MVYLHGIADNRSSGTGIIERFVARGFDTVTYDSRAHGDSDGDTCTYGFFEKDDLRRVLDTLGPGPIVLIGASLGAAVALQHAGRDPRVAAVAAEAEFSRRHEIEPVPGEVIMEIFFPLSQHPRNWSVGLPLAVVRIDGPLGAVVPALQAALRDVQPQAETARGPFLYAEALGRLTAQRRFSARLMTVFGVLALVIGAAGVYAVMAFVVGRRTREIGIRIAVGASPARVLAVVLSEAGRHLAAGLVLGLLAALAVTSGLASVLFGVSASDPTVYSLAALVVAFVGLTAALIPAIRATRVDPAVTLRAE